MTIDYLTISHNFRPLLLVSNLNDTKILSYLISEIDALGPFSALGFFTVDLTTFTSIISTALTYLIILAQFNKNCYAPEEFKNRDNQRSGHPFSSPHPNICLHNYYHRRSHQKVCLQYMVLVGRSVNILTNVCI